MALISFMTAAASADATDSAWSVQMWKSDDGLPNNYVTDLAQTPDGYLWVATYASPARFDGIRFEDFSSKELAGGSPQKIMALALNRDGGLWMGALHGAVLLVNSKSLQIFKDGLPYKQVQTLTEDSEGTVWITYQGGAVGRIKGGRAKKFTNDDGWPQTSGDGTRICSLTRDTEGRIWFAKNGQVGVIRDERFETLVRLPRITTRVTGASSGGVWICSGSRLLKYAEGKTLEEHGAFSATSETQPTVLLEDRTGGLWIGTSDRGLFHYDGARFEHVETSAPSITSLLEDRKGNIWVGTQTGGLNCVRPRIIALETVETGLPFNVVQSICEDTDGKVWAATRNGLLLRQEKEGWTKISNAANWPGGEATTVAADSTGAVWIGTRDRALHRWHGGEFSSWSKDDGLTSREIHGLLVSKRGDVWIGQTGPDVVQRWRGGRLTTFKMPPNIRIIRAMAEDARGDIWIGTSKGMLVRISGDEVVDETSRTTGEPLSIRCLHVTEDGGLWIGYADEGVGWLKDRRFVHLSSARGFPENHVSQIVSDRRGWLWFGGDSGIFKVRRQELEELANGGRNHVHRVRYGQSEGLFSVEANCGDSPGTLASRDGRLWMPMRSALAVVDAKRVHEDLEPPAVLLKRVMVDDRAVASYGGVVPVRSGIDLDDPQAELRLPPEHHRLAFDFTALGFAGPENIRFRYRLSGFDDAWVEAGGARSAGYSRLPAGDYRFHVQACNSDGIWNEEGAALAFTVLPFVWQTWWFQMLALGLFTSLTVIVARRISLRRIRTKLQSLEQQTALHKERVRIARDLHDDLGSCLTKIVVLNDLTLDYCAASEQASRSASQVSATAREVIKSLDETVWALNPRNDTLADLVDYIGQFAVDFLEAAGIRCRLDLPANVSPRALSAELRHNLFMVAKEALHNVVRHSGASEVRLRIVVAREHLELTIADNGKGLAERPESPGADGLLNMRQRMEEMGGNFRIESAPAAGTRVEATIPWQSATAGATVPRALQGER